MKFVLVVLMAVMVGGCSALSFPEAGAMEAAATDSSHAFGKAAPAFTLPDQDGKKVSLVDFNGRWVVLYFYPADDTPGCTCEATDFTRLLTRLKGEGAEVLAVSPDSPAAHRRFREQYKLGVTLLSDEGHEVMGAYGVWVEHPLAGGRVVRQTYVVGPNGRVAWHWPEVMPVGHAERVAERVRLLKRAYSGS